MPCNCLPCFNNDDDEEETENQAPPQPAAQEAPLKRDTPAQAAPTTETASPVPSHVKTFNFRELAMATKNFRQECLIGEGGFGRVFKGKLKSGETVAVKQLDRNGMQGNKEFENVVAALSVLEHSNLLSLIGYCADGDQRLLVHEYMEMGSLDKHLFDDDPEKKPMDWFTRMKIAAGAAQGLEYLHDSANPPVIFRDLKASNILLDENYEVKLSDFGNVKLESGGNMNPTARVMGTYGYSAPEYTSSGELTLKSDIYSFGVVLLELIAGRRVVDTNRPNDEQNLVTWAQPIFRDTSRFPDLADSRLNKEFPVKGLNQAVGICAMCLQEESEVRPLVTDLVAALSFLAIPQPIPPPSPEPLNPPPEQKMDYPNADPENTDEEEEEEEEDDDYSSDEGDDNNSHSDEEYRSDNDKHEENDSKEERIRSVTSRKGSKRRSSSTKKDGTSSGRKVTFKEPNLSSKRNRSKKTKTKRKGSGSSSESSDDEKKNEDNQ